MGLNLETLVTILVILIIAILADGVRRMLKDRHTRLRLRIDPKAKAAGSEPYQDTNPELPSGGARTIRKAPRRTPGMGDLDGISGTPPLAMEREEKPPAVHQAVQTELFAEPKHESQPETKQEPERQPQQGEQADSRQGRIDPANGHRGAPSTAKAGAATAHTAQKQDSASGSTSSQQADPSDSKPAANSRSAAAGAADDIIEVLALHLVTSAEQPMDGRDLLSALLEQGLRFGAMNIFHRHQSRNGRDELQFSMANALEPGTFDIDAMEGQRFRALTFFLKLPGPSAPSEALDRMLNTVQQLASRFQADIRDDQHSALSQQTIGHLREKVRDFERRQRVSGV